MDICKYTPFTGQKGWESSAETLGDRIEKMVMKIGGTVCNQQCELP